MTEPPVSNSPDVAASQQEKALAEETKVPTSRARRIYGYTCNLLATALVLYAGVTFGRQVMSWWKVEDPQLQPAHQSLEGLGTTGINAAEIPLELEIGDWPATLVRAEFTGDTQAAQKELRHLCQAALKDATFPKQPAGPAELKMLASLEGKEPLARLPDGWELYEQSGPVPFIAAVGTVPESARTPTGPLKSGLARSSEVASAARRVVSWGLGVHLAGTRWTLLLLTTREGSNPTDPDRPSVPLPPDAKRVLSLAAAERESIVSFTGSGSLEQWQTFYDQHFAQTATSQFSDWQQLGNVWQQHYRTPSASIEIQLGTSPDSKQIQGLLTVRSKPKNADSNSPSPP